MSTASVAPDQLRAFVERIERMDEELKGINDDKKEIYAEAKGNGFDVAAIKHVVKLRRMDHDERMHREAIIELYLSALGMSVAPTEEEAAAAVSRAPAPARTRENIEEFDPETGEVIEPASASHAADAGDAEPVREQVEASPELIEFAGQAEGDADGQQFLRGGAEVARVAHNHEAAGSSPAPATSSPVPDTAPHGGDGLKGAAPDPLAGENADQPDTRTPVQKIMDEVQAKHAQRRPGETWTETCPPAPVTRHEHARCFPEHFGMGRAELADDIRASGVQRPIVKIGDVILDGWARYTIARDLKLSYPVKEYDGSDPLADLIRWQLESRGPNLPRQSIASKLMKLVPDRVADIAELFGVEFAHVEKTRQVA